MVAQLEIHSVTEYLEFASVKINGSIPVGTAFVFLTGLNYVHKPCVYNLNIYKLNTYTQVAPKQKTRT